MSATLTKLREEMHVGPTGRPFYSDEMMHTIPNATVVNRGEYVLERVKGKVILNLGHSGPMAEAVEKVAKRCYGIDLAPSKPPYLRQLDLDNLEADKLPQWDSGLNDGNIELVVAGEILEHLANPGRMLEVIRNTYQCPLLITVPNAFSAGGQKWAKSGTENVNLEHVAYYSYYTLLALVERYGYKVREWHWYKGKPFTAEGLIFLVE